MKYTFTIEIIESSSNAESRNDKKQIAIDLLGYWKNYMYDHLDGEFPLLIMDEIIKIQDQLHDEFSMDWEEIDELFIRL